MLLIRNTQRRTTARTTLVAAMCVFLCVYVQWSRMYRRTQRRAQHSKYNVISRLFSFSHFQHVPTDVCLLLCRSTLFLYRMSQKNEPVNLSLTLLKQITFLNSYFWLQFIHHYLTKYQPAFIELCLSYFSTNMQIFVKCTRYVRHQYIGLLSFRYFSVKMQVFVIRIP